jgi:hypothetical protein
MRIEEHRCKAESIERSLTRCTYADYEIVIEGAMLAASHWFNILLHHARLTPEERDVIHAEFLTMGERRKVRLASAGALDALDEIERLRTLHVRGDMPGGQHASLRALEFLSQLRDEAISRTTRSA